MENKKHREDLQHSNVSEGLHIGEQHLEIPAEDFVPATKEEELELRKQRTHFASTKPDKDHIG